MVPISIRPGYVILNGQEGMNITRSVEILAELNKPLTLEPDQNNLEGKIDYKIEEIEKGRRFKINFTNLPSLTGSFRGFLNLKTNYEEKLVITVRVAGKFRKAPEVQRGKN